MNEERIPVIGDPEPDIEVEEPEEPAEIDGTLKPKLNPELREIISVRNLAGELYLASSTLNMQELVSLSLHIHKILFKPQRKIKGGGYYVG